jgi:hypothetical protein
MIGTPTYCDREADESRDSFFDTISIRNRDNSLRGERKEEVLLNDADFFSHG